MRSYLNSQGYYNAIFTNLDSSYHFDTAKDNQIRTSINFKIDPGKNTIIDSLVYVIGDHFLDSISKVNLKNSYIKVGKTPFSKQVIASELDRLVALFRQGDIFTVKGRSSCRGRHNRYCVVADGNRPFLNSLPR